MLLYVGALLGFLASGILIYLALQIDCHVMQMFTLRVEAAS